MGLANMQWATAALYNGLGRYEDALAAAQQAGEHPQELWATLVLPELIEAAARTGKTATAADALQRLSETTRASGTEWALGTEARSRALLTDGEAAESLYREAIGRLGHSRLRVALARALLLYGEWLRRQHRRLDAREQLRSAHELFTAFGMKAFADRAARELSATGERARKRTNETTAQLTARETQIGRLAGDGLSNPEIAAQLFMSPRTVEYHLHKIFTKLDISSRNQLHGVLASHSITIARRMRAKLAEVKDQLKRRMHQSIPEQGRWLASVVRGHMAYYAVPGNTQAVAAFRDQVTRHWLKALRRRSQKTRITWQRIGRIEARWLPPARVMHPYPNVRFDARTQGRSPVR
jgi:DNA-binding CsgD family transcriptional regulator